MEYQVPARRLIEIRLSACFLTVLVIPIEVAGSEPSRMRRAAAAQLRVPFMSLYCMPCAVEQSMMGDSLRNCRVPQYAR